MEDSYEDHEHKIKPGESHIAIRKFFNHRIYKMETSEREIRITKKSSKKTLVISIRSDFFDFTEDCGTYIVAGIEDDI